MSQTNSWHAYATANSALLRKAGDLTLNAQLHNTQLTDAQQAFAANLDKVTAAQADPQTDSDTLLHSYRQLVASAQQVIAEAGA